MTQVANGCSRPSGPSRLDRALSHLVEGHEAAALREVATLLEGDPKRSVALWLAGRLLASSGRGAEAELALRAAAWAGLTKGTLVVAAAATCQLRAMGLASDDLEEELARVFCRESPHLADQGRHPPDLTNVRRSQVPKAGDLTGEALLDHVSSLALGDQVRKEELEASGDWRVVPQPFFSRFHGQGLRRLLGALELATVAKGEQILHQGEMGDEAFFLAQGEVDILRQNDGGETITLAHLGAGSLFGEMALLSRAPRAATVVATRPGILLYVRRDALERLAREHPPIGHDLAEFGRQRMVDNLVRISPILNRVKPGERSSLMQRFVARAFEAGEQIIVQGEDGQGLHLIASGEVAVVYEGDDDRTILARLGAGNVVGEISLVLRRPSGANVVATTPVVTLHLPRDEFLEIVRSHPTVLQHLYELAVEREQETSSIVGCEATEVDDVVLT